jgi:N-acetylmuramoyl-L-alanine amidase
MVKQILVAMLVACSTLSSASAAPTVRAMYNDALAKEAAVRKALDDPEATEAVLKAVRETIASYEAVVRRYPSSSYCDNALWQAGRLALDAYARFNHPQDQEIGERLLRRLVAAYPSSKLARQVPAATAGAAATAGTAPAVDEPKRASAVPAARPAAGIVTIRDIRRSVLPDAVRVVIELDGEVPSFHQDRIPDPSRVFVDLPSTRASAALLDQTIRFEADADVVRQVRIGRHPNNTTRVVLDVNGVSSYSVYPLYEPYRLVIDCVRAGGAAAAPMAAAPPPARAAAPVKASPPPPAPVAKREPAPVPVAVAVPGPGAPIIRRVPAPLPARASANVLLRAAPSNVSQHGVLIAEAHAALDLPPMPPDVTTVAPSMAKPPEAPALPPAVRNSTGGLSIARQLGLSVSRIVIDPGHGGHDPGAKGKGVIESELVLDVALRLEKLLQQVPGVEVILTRREDEFVQLPERTAIANREGADLFLSIHANASKSSQARGIETYFLNFASNLSAAAVAARENASSTQAMGALPDFVKAIALNNKVDESRDLAAAVQRSMIEQLKPSNKLIRDLGVKQAPFVVLIGAVMPSVLAEISFITNPQEARLVKSSGYRQKIAEALFTAIRKYQTSLKNVTAVASQQ